MKSLVLTAIIISQMAGLWLRYVLIRGWPLLSTDPDDRGQFAVPEPPALPQPAPRPQPQLLHA